MFSFLFQRNQVKIFQNNLPDMLIKNQTFMYFYKMKFLNSLFFAFYCFLLFVTYYVNYIHLAKRNLIEIKIVNNVV